MQHPFQHNKYVINDLTSDAYRIHTDREQLGNLITGNISFQLGRLKEKVKEGSVTYQSRSVEISN